MLHPKGFAWVGLYAQDPVSLAAFYEQKVGLALVEGDAQCCIFDAGAGSLFEVWAKGHASTPRKSSKEQSMIVGFLVDDLDPAVAGMRQRGLQPDTAIDSYLGTRWIYFTDPEGNRFELKDRRG